MSVWPPPQQSNDPFSFLGVVPNWLKGAGDVAGGVMGALGNAPVVGGALQALGTLALPARYAAGAAGMAADKFLDTGLERATAAEHPNQNWWETPLNTQETLFNRGFQSIAEDPNQPAWARIAAQVPRAAELTGEMRAPLPIAKSLKGLAYGPEKVAPTVRGALTNLGKDLLPGYREVQTARAIGSKVGSIVRGERPTTTVHALDEQGNLNVDDLNARTGADQRIDLQNIDPNAALKEGVPVAEQLSGSRAVRPFWFDEPKQVLSDIQKEEAVAAKAKDMPPAELAQRNALIDSQQTTKYGRPVWDMTLSDMWRQNGISYDSLEEARRLARTYVSRLGRGTPGLHEFGEPDSVSIEYYDKDGYPVGMTHMARRPSNASDPVTGKELRQPAWTVGEMYVDDTSPAAPVAMRDILASLARHNVSGGGSLSYYSAKLLHDSAVSRRLASGGEIRPEVMSEQDPLTGRPMYTPQQVEKMRQGKIFQSTQESTIRVPARNAPRPRNSADLYANYDPQVENAFPDMMRAHYNAVSEIAKRQGLKVRSVLASGRDLTRNQSLDITVLGDPAKVERAAAEMGHFYDSENVQVFHATPEAATGTPASEAKFITTRPFDPEFQTQLQRELQLWSPDMTVVWGHDVSGSALKVLMKNVNPDAFALFISRLNDKLMRNSRGWDQAKPTATWRSGRVVDLGRAEQDAALQAGGTGLDAERPAQAGGTATSTGVATQRGEGNLIGPDSAWRNIPQRVRTGGAQVTDEAVTPYSSPATRGVAGTGGHDFRSYESEPPQQYSGEEPEIYNPEEDTSLDQSYTDPLSALEDRSVDTFRTSDNQFYRTAGRWERDAQGTLVVDGTDSLHGDEHQIPVRDINAIFNGDGDIIYDIGNSSRPGSAVLPARYGAGAAEAEAHAEEIANRNPPRAPIFNTVEDAINSPQAVSVIDDQNNIHDLPEDLQPLRPGGASVRTTTGRIDRARVVRVLDDLGNFIYQEGGAKRIDFGMSDVLDRLRGRTRNVTEEGTVQAAAVGPESPYVTGGGRGEPPRGTGGAMGNVPTEPLSVSPPAPGMPIHVAPPGPPTPESIAMQEHMTEATSAPTSFAEALDRASNRQRSTAVAITNRLREHGYIEGTDAAKLVNYLDRMVAENDITAEEAAKVRKVLDPVLTAQAFYDSVKDINDQVAAAAKQALTLTEQKYGEALRGVLKVESSLNRVDDRIAAQTERSAGRVQAIDERYAAAVKNVEAATENALNALANGEVRDIMRTTDALDAALAALDVGEVRPPRRMLNDTEAEKLVNLGRLSPGDKDILAKYGFNLSKYHPLVAKRIAEGIKANEAEWTSMHEVVSHAQQLQMAADYVGVKPEELESEMAARGLTEPGDMAGFLIGIRLAVSKMASDMRKLEASGADNKAISAALEDFNRFTMKVGGATSEIARALGSQRQVITQRLYSAFGEKGFMRSVGQKVAQATAKTDAAAQKVAEIQDLYDRKLDDLANTTDARMKTAHQRAADATKVELDKAKATFDALNKEKTALQDAYKESATRLQEALSNLDDAALQEMIASSESIEQVRAVLRVHPYDIDTIVGVMKNTHKITNGDRLIAYISNNAYSGIVSQEANAIGGILRIIPALIETKVAEEVGKVYSRLTGKAAVIQPGETGAMLGGLKRGLTEPGDEYFIGTHSVPHALQVSLDTILKGQALEAGSLRHTTAFKGKLGIPLEFWIRTNGAFDAFWRHLMGASEQDALYLNHARRSLIDEGTALTPENVSLRMAEMMKDFPQDIVDQSARIAANATYADVKFSPMMENILKVFNTKVNLPWLGDTAVLKAVFLATRFTWAATSYSMDLSPIGLVRAANRLRGAREAGVAGDVAQAEELYRQAARMGSRGAVGSAAMVAALQMYQSGQLIGKDPEGRGRDDSIIVGDKAIPLRVLWPLSAPFIYVARMGDSIKTGQVAEEEFPQLLGRAALGWGDALTQQPFLRTTHDLVDAVKMGGDPLLRVSSSVVGRLVPWSSFDRDVSKVIDSWTRDPGSGDFAAMLAQNIPLASQMVNKKVDRWGQPIVNKPGGLARLYPFASAEQDESASDAVINDLHATINPNTGKPYLSAFAAPGKNIGNVTLTNDEHNLWQNIAGQQRKDAIGTLVATTFFQQMSKKDQAAALTRTDNRALDQAKATFAKQLMQSPDPQTQLKGAVIGISATASNYGRAHLVSDILSTLNENPGLAAAFDQYRGKGDLSLAQYKQAVPYLNLLDNSPEFATSANTPIGNDQVWDQYHRELKEYAALIKNTPRQAGQIPLAARVYLLRHPTLRRYMALAGRPGGKNPVITRLRARQPVLNYIRLPAEQDELDAQSAGAVEPSDLAGG